MSFNPKSLFELCMLKTFAVYPYHWGETECLPDSIRKKLKRYAIEKKIDVYSRDDLREILYDWNGDYTSVPEFLAVMNWPESEYPPYAEDTNHVMKVCYKWYTHSAPRILKGKLCLTCYMRLSDIDMDDQYLRWMHKDHYFVKAERHLRMNAGQIHRFVINPSNWCSNCHMSALFSIVERNWCHQCPNIKLDWRSGRNYSFSSSDSNDSDDDYYIKKLEVIIPNRSGNL